LVYSPLRIFKKGFGETLVGGYYWFSGKVKEQAKVKFENLITIFQQLQKLQTKIQFSRRECLASVEQFIAQGQTIKNYLYF